MSIGTPGRSLLRTQLKLVSSIVHLCVTHKSLEVMPMSEGATIRRPTLEHAPASTPLRNHVRAMSDERRCTGRTSNGAGEASSATSNSP